MSLLSLEGIRKSFGDNVVLRDIDLTVERGQCVVLIGASGSGKSTLLRCVNLLEVVDDGRITLEGDDITDPRIDADAVRARMGVVFQAYNLFPHLTVLDNCTLAPRRVHGLSRAEAEDRARDLLARFGLGEHVDKHPDRLSGGQQQRAALVRALRFFRTEGALPMSRIMAAKLVAYFQQAGAAGGQHDGPSFAGGAGDPLSPREREVLAEVATGLTDAEVAERLVISEHTAKKHLQNTRRKLGVRNRIEALSGQISFHEADLVLWSLWRKLVSRER